MDGCVFCKIARGELPGMKVYEDAHALAIMDIAGDVDGHMIALPKAHVESILDCDDETLARLALAVKRLSEYLVSKCGYDGVNLLNASGASAGQSVSHFHIHVIPRRRGDGIDAWPRFGGASRPVDAVFREIAGDRG